MGRKVCLSLAVRRDRAGVLSKNNSRWLQNVPAAPTVFTFAEVAASGCNAYKQACDYKGRACCSEPAFENVKTSAVAIVRLLMVRHLAAEVL